MKTQPNNKKKRLATRIDLDKDLVTYAKRVNNEEIGVIKYLGSRDIDMCEVTFETDDETFAKVAEIGLEMVKNDKHKLFGYAIVRAIEDVVEEEKRAKKCSKT